jgi:hypothetical protein
MYSYVITVDSGGASAAVSFCSDTDEWRTLSPALDALYEWVTHEGTRGV